MIAFLSSTTDSTIAFGHPIIAQAADELWREEDPPDHDEVCGLECGHNLDSTATKFGVVVDASCT